MTRTTANRVADPAYSPGGALSNFLFFGHLKGEMAGLTASSAEGIHSEIRRIFETIPKDILTAVYNEWITRLEWITKHRGRVLSHGLREIHQLLK
jgi:hypothetical protein